MLGTLRIENNGFPVDLQIRDRIIEAIEAGMLKSGERLPTMREVAVALKVDLNSVRRAYEFAQETGAIVIDKARGSFVAGKPPADVSQTDKLDRLARRTIAIATAAGIDPAVLSARIVQIRQSQTQRETKT